MAGGQKREGYCGPLDKNGVENVRVVVEGSLNLGIKFLTLFGFSSENWKRTPTEIFDLMSYLSLPDNEIHDLHKKIFGLKSSAIEKSSMQT